MSASLFRRVRIYNSYLACLRKKSGGLSKHVRKDTGLSNILRLSRLRFEYISIKNFYESLLPGIGGARDDTTIPANF